MDYTQTEAPPSYDSVVNQNTCPPSYPSLQALSATQIQPYYIPQPIPQTPAPCLVETIPPQRRQVLLYRSKRSCYGGSGGSAFVVVLLVIAVGLGVHYGPSLWALSDKDMQIETCSPSSVNCDGKRDCSQGSDEARCVRFGTANELLVMTSKAGSFLPVCAQGFSKDTADQTCQQLGFRQSYAKGVLQSNSSSFQSVNSLFSNTIQGSVEISSSCPHQQTVSLSCCDCGRPPVSTRIIGGTVAVDGQWPWQASLHFRGYHTCGGTLVAPDFIITAAHCFPQETSDYLLPSNWKVYIGMVSQLKLPSPYNVKQIIVHENYDPETKNNDIALLKLNRPVSSIQSACLPVFGQTFFPGSQCWTTGFGVTKEGGDSGSTYLMEVAVDLIDLAECNKPTVYSGLITETMQCAGDLRGGKDSCQGDSGGPLVCKADNRWYLTGVTSWGDGCGKKNRPGVYSNVGRLLTWIQSKMQQERP
ncbi:transmembrane protease serine 13-like isoform X1 [Xyrauchen texanus]|uniref:transmembrane protease serine 13-like isoform X1 n=1 Tax=Xyrauchen texanus TaxID=154827 RepID=UPI0022428597|nr:transmembrane protease serine 13-like isoform X1 [Xyrauchen texanus]